MSRITPETQNSVEKILKRTGILSNFTCFPQLFAFCTNASQKLHLFTHKGKQRILLYKTPQNGLREVRILFSRSANDKSLIEKIKRECNNPQYIAYNLLKKTEVHNQPKAKPRTELILDNKTVANLEDSKVRKHYNAAVRRQPELRYIPASWEDKARIFGFLDNWCNTVGRKFTPDSRAKNDRRLINSFLDSGKIDGGLAVYKNKVIGIEFHAPHPVDPHLAVAIIGKNLRGYTYLGDWLTVKRAKRLLNEGYKRIIIGGLEIPSQTSFKKKFDLNGKEVNYYSLEVYRDKQLQKNEIDLFRIWG